MSLYKNKYRVESTRLPGWDYSSSGHYFVTICTKDMVCYFGNVVDGEMKLSISGCKAVGCWLDIPNHFPFVTLGAFVVMPNHVHGVLTIDRGDRNSRDAIYRVSSSGGVTRHNNPMGRDTLGEVIRWFKGRCTFEIRKSILKQFKWHPRFHDHIIRDENALQNIRNYINKNPLKWDTKKFRAYK